MGEHKTNKVTRKRPNQLAREQRDRGPIKPDATNNGMQRHGTGYAHQAPKHGNLG